MSLLETALLAALWSAKDTLETLHRTHPQSYRARCQQSLKAARLAIAMAEEAE